MLTEGRRMREMADILKFNEKAVLFHKYHIKQSFQSQKQLGPGLVRAQALADPS